VGASYLLFTLTFALVFYVLGATFVESLVNYRSWRFIGESEFKNYHRAIGRRVIPLVVLPFVLSVALTIALVPLHPSLIPVWSLWLSLIVDLIAIVVSVVFQIPLQLEFDRNGKSSPALERLIAIEWIRNAAHCFNAVLFVWMMMRLSVRFA